MLHIQSHDTKLAFEAEPRHRAFTLSLKEEFAAGGFLQ